MAQNLSIKASIRGTQDSPIDLGTPAFALDMLAALNLTDGTGANQADRLFTDTRTISASSSDALDLAGALTSAFGATITFARIKAVFIKAAAGNTNDVQVTRPAANGVPLFLAASDGIVVPPGGALLWVAPGATGVPVTAGTGDLLTIVNGGAGTSVTYDVAIVGCSA